MSELKTTDGAGTASEKKTALAFSKISHELNWNVNMGRKNKNRRCLHRNKVRTANGE